MPDLLVIVAARNEADRIGATLDALAATFPRAELWVADDASEDRTSAVALGHGARVVSRGRPHGKGANVTAAAEAALGAEAGSSPRRGEEAEASARRGEGARCGSWSRPSSAASATSRSPPFAVASAAASGWPCGSRAG